MRTVESEPCRQYSTISLMEISKSIHQNLDYSERNQILPNNDTPKFGNSQKMIPKNPGETPKSTQNNGKSSISRHVEGTPRDIQLEHTFTYATVNFCRNHPPTPPPPPLEIVKCGFWCKLPLLPLLCHANAIDEN